MAGGRMKRALLVLLALSVFYNQAVAYCRPGYSGTESDEGCDYLHKNVTWSIQWPDGYFTPLQANGTGMCTYTQVCCTPDYVQLQCWPAFYTPVVTDDGSFSQTIGNQDYLEYFTECDAGCTSPLFVKGCYEVSRGRAEVSHSCPG